jgi:hypothetical protein
MACSRRVSWSWTLWSVAGDSRTEGVGWRSRRSQRWDSWRRPCRRTAPTTQSHDQEQLSGEDGNAFAILGRTAAGLRRAGAPKQEIDAYFPEATSSDNDHLLQTTMAWVDWE